MTVIHPTAIVDRNANVGQDAEIGPYAVVGPHVTLGDGVKVMGHVFLDGWTTIGAGCTIFPFASIGTQTQDLKYAGARTCVSIGEKTTLREYVTVNSATNEGEVTKVGSNCHIMAYSHVAHACAVGNGVIIANGGMLGGHLVVEDQAVIGGLCALHQFVRIGRLAMLGAMSKITQDVPPFMMADGNPASVRGINAVGLERRNVDPEARKALKHAHRVLYRDGLSTRQALEKIRAEVTMCPEVRHLIGFVEASERGIIK